MSVLKTVSVCFKNESFGFLFWTSPKQDKQMAFVQTIELETGITHLQGQLHDIYDEHWEPEKDALISLKSYLNSDGSDAYYQAGIITAIPLFNKGTALYEPISPNSLGRWVQRNWSS